MSTFYQIYGTLVCRDTPEFREIVEEIDELLLDDFECNVAETDEPDVVVVEFGDGMQCSMGHADRVDATVQKLSPHVVTGACLFTEANDGEEPLFVGPEAEKARALSAYTKNRLLEQFDLELLTPDDASDLIFRIEEAVWGEEQIAKPKED